MSAAENALRGRTVLVTGASGFIGLHLCRRLQAADAVVHAISGRLRSDDDLTWWQCDLADAQATSRVLSAVKPSLVYHLASTVTGSRDLPIVFQTFRDNLATTVHLLIASSEAGVSRVVLTGSMEEGVGNLPGAPCSPYAASKSAATAYGRMFLALYGLSVVHLRVGMVYGPGPQDFRKLVPYVILELLRGRAPALGSGVRKVDWIYVEDVVEGMLRAGSVESIDAFSVDIGTGRLTSIRSVVELLIEMIDPSVRPCFGARADPPLEIGYAADADRSLRQLGWRAGVCLEDGLRRTLDWFAATHADQFEA
jgi:UDP-glucose 4-epimerase